jgi:predicted aldo/keto reductase-like oxidoreductase
MEPLRGGNLARKLPRPVQELFDGSEVKRTPAEWALRWLWNRPEIITVLSGMNDESHIEENLRIAGEGLPDSLTANELDTVKRVEKKYRELMAVPCTGCRYCMPCPAGVAIPSCFDAYNISHLWGNKREAMFQYIIQVGHPLSGGRPDYASNCTDCGQCEEACPQGIEIRKHLKEVSKEFEGFKLKFFIALIKLFVAVKRWKNLRAGAER